MVDVGSVNSDKLNEVVHKQAIDLAVIHGVIVHRFFHGVHHFWFKGSFQQFAVPVHGSARRQNFRKVYLQSIYLPELLRVCSTRLPVSVTDEPDDVAPSPLQLPPPGPLMFAPPLPELSEPATGLP